MSLRQLRFRYVCPVGDEGPAARVPVAGELGASEFGASGRRCCRLQQRGMGEFLQAVGQSPGSHEENDSQAGELHLLQMTWALACDGNNEISEKPPSCSDASCKPR